MTLPAVALVLLAMSLASIASFGISLGLWLLVKTFATRRARDLHDARR